MPLAIQFDGYQSCPIIVCDWCQRPITDARTGGYFWRSLSKDEGDTAPLPFPTRGDTMPLIFLHKGRCDERYGAQHGAPEAWEELRQLPIYLARNLCTHRHVTRQRQCKDCGLDLPGGPR
jgi:hypothetical protein